MTHCLIVYNAVPDFNPKTKDLKSEIGILASVDEIARRLSKTYQLTIYPFTGDIIHFMQTLQSKKPDVVFNLFEGVYGLSQSEALIPLALEVMDVPYTGSSSATLKQCLNKPEAKAMMAQKGIPTPDFKRLASGDDVQFDGRFPLIVKPEHEDASIGISQKSVVYDAEALLSQVSFIWDSFHQAALLEQYIEGREFNVAVVGNSDDAKNKLMVLPISEIDFSGMPKTCPNIVTYNGKWKEDSEEYRGTVPVCPAHLTKSEETALQDLAMAVYNLFECRGYARVDFRQDLQGEFYVIDVNPNPDLSRDAGLSNAAQKAGYDYDMLLKKIISLALNA